MFFFLTFLSVSLHMDPSTYIFLLPLLTLSPPCLTFTFLSLPFPPALSLPPLPSLSRTRLTRSGKREQVTGSLFSCGFWLLVDTLHVPLCLSALPFLLLAFRFLSLALASLGRTGFSSRVASLWAVLLESGRGG